MNEIIIVRVEIKRSIIGMNYQIFDNSQITLAGTKISGRLYGCVTEIVSEPFVDYAVPLFKNEAPTKETFIFVRSLDSGLIYRVPFNPDCVKVSTKPQKETLVYKKMKINDNSYNKSAFTGKWQNLFGKEVVIISKPYIEAVDGREHLFIDVFTNEGDICRVLFNEDAILDPYNSPFFPR